MPNNPPAKVVHHGDVLNALPDDDTQRALAQLDQLKTWLCFQGGKADAGLSVALSVWWTMCAAISSNDKPCLPNAPAGEAMMTPPKFRTWAEVEAWSLGMMHLADCVSTDALIKMTSLVSRVRADHEHLKPEARND